MTWQPSGRPYCLTYLVLFKRRINVIDQRIKLINNAIGNISPTFVHRRLCYIYLAFNSWLLARKLVGHFLPTIGWLTSVLFLNKQISLLKVVEFSKYIACLQHPRPPRSLFLVYLLHFLLSLMCGVRFDQQKGIHFGTSQHQTEQSLGTLSGWIETIN